MISKQNIELVRSLAQKKHREEIGLFVAEGEKIVFDLLKTKLKLSILYYTSDGITSFKVSPPGKNWIQVSTKEMERMSAFRTPSGMLALFEIPPYQEVAASSLDGLNLVLDGLQDPGNLGTIIRLADWFGIQHIFCSENCVDNFNPKCVQSTMGAVARVKVHYLDLKSLLQEAGEQKIPVYGTFMDGVNLYEAELTSQAFVVLGSEGKGISADLEPLLTGKLSIPTFPSNNKIPESLNVAVSAAIVCAEFRRRISKEN